MKIGSRRNFQFLFRLVQVENCNHVEDSPSNHEKTKEKKINLVIDYHAVHSKILDRMLTLTFNRTASSIDADAW